MRTTVTTLSGIEISIPAPRAEEIRRDDLAVALSNICRWGGHVRTFYSVAQHCVHVSKLVERQVAGTRKAREFERAALLHDAAEAYLGDVITPLKVLLADYKPIEVHFLEAIFFRFDVPTGYAEKLPEIVKWADSAALYLESRDLRAVRETGHGALLDRHAPLVPLSPQDARDAYLARFRELFGEE